MAVSIIQTEDYDVEAHEYLDALKNVDSEAFRKAYQEEKERYRLPVVEK